MADCSKNRQQPSRKYESCAKDCFTWPRSEVEGQDKCQTAARKTFGQEDPRSKIQKDTDLINLIKEEVNVKEVTFDANLSTEVELDLDITPELKEEGELRDLIRAIQDRRKDQGLTIQDRPTLKIFVEDKTKQIFIEKNKQQLIKAVLLKNIETVEKEEGEEVTSEAIPRDRGSLMSATARVGENFQQKIVRAPEALGSRSSKGTSAVVGKEYEFELKM